MCHESALSLIPEIDFFPAPGASRTRSAAIDVSNYCLEYVMRKRRDAGTERCRAIYKILETAAELSGPCVADTPA